MRRTSSILFNQSTCRKTRMISFHTHNSHLTLALILRSAGSDCFGCVIFFGTPKNSGRVWLGRALLWISGNRECGGCIVQHWFHCIVFPTNKKGSTFSKNIYSHLCVNSLWCTASCTRCIYLILMYGTCQVTPRWKMPWHISIIHFEET